MSTRRPIAIYLRASRLVRPLFAELDRRGTSVRAGRRRRPPSTIRGAGDVAVVARLQPHEPVGLPARPPRHLRYTLCLPRATSSACGVPVVNGERAFRHRDLEGAAARAARSARPAATRAPRVINHGAQAPAAAAGLRFPVVVKANIGGSGAGIVRFDTPERTSRPRRARGAARPRRRQRRPGAGVRPGARRPHHPRRGAGRQVPLRHPTSSSAGGTFNLCPADICQTTGGASSSPAACAVDAPKTGLRVEGYAPPPAAIADGRARSCSARRLDVGGIEYMIDDRDGRLVLLRHQRAVELRRRRPAGDRLRSRSSALVDYLDASGHERRGGRRLTMPVRYRLLDAGLRRLAAQRRRRGHGRRPGTTSRRLARRSEQIGYDLTLVAELNLNDIKGIDGAGARRLVHRRRARRGHRAAGADGRRAADLPPAGAARQAGRQHRPHRRRPAVAQRRLVLVGGRGDEATASTSSSTTTATRRTAEWLDVVDGVWTRDHFTYEGQLLPGRRHRSCEPKPVRGRAR